MGSSTDGPSATARMRPSQPAQRFVAPYEAPPTAPAPPLACAPSIQYSGAAAHASEGWGAAAAPAMAGMARPGKGVPVAAAMLCINAAMWSVCCVGSRLAFSFWPILASRGCWALQTGSPDIGPLAPHAPEKGGGGGGGVACGAPASSPCTGRASPAAWP
eukprot:7701826-Pyramimonas_sp.AAC.1